MSADHGLDREIGLARLADDIKRHERMISELRTLQMQGSDALNFNVVTSTSGPLTIPTAGVSYFGFNLSSATNRRLFVAPMDFTLYEGSIAPGNEIGHGNLRDLGYLWWYWRDKKASDGNNIFDKVYVNNFSGSTKNVYIDVTFRFVLAPDAS